MSDQNPETHKYLQWTFEGDPRLGQRPPELYLKIRDMETDVTYVYAVRELMLTIS